MLSNHSRGNLMSFTDHSAQCRFKSNTPDNKQKVSLAVGGANAQISLAGAPLLRSLF